MIEREAVRNNRNYVKRAHPGINAPKLIYAKQQFATLQPAVSKPQENNKSLPVKQQLSQEVTNKDNGVENNSRPQYKRKAKNIES
jgi:hypothetical protein